MRDELVLLLQEYAGEAERLGQVFAERNGMHPTDLYALLAVMQAEAAGAPLTPGRLGEHLGPLVRRDHRRDRSPGARSARQPRP